MAGVTTETTDSIDFSPVLRGESSTRKFAYVEHFGNSGKRGPDKFGWAIRDERYKLVAEDNQTQSLFDLKEDPLETNDLLANTEDETSRQKALALQQAADAIVNR